MLAICAAVLVGRHSAVGQVPASSTNVSIAIVIDNSGSTRDTDPDGLRFVAARQIVDLTEPGDELAAITFSEDVRVPLSLRLVQHADADHAQMRALLQSVPPETWTNMVPAVQAAREQLARASNPRRLLIFLTDGGLEPGPPFQEQNLPAEKLRLLDEVQKALADGIHTYTIGLKSAIDPALLELMAEKGGGQFLSAPTAEDLPPQFQRIFELEGLTTFNLLFNDCLDPGASRDLPFAVHKFVTGLSLFVTSPESAQITSSLVPPIGSAMTPTSVDPSYAAFHVTGPLNGRWTLHVVNGGTTRTCVRATSNLRADVIVRWRQPTGNVGKSASVPLEMDITGRLPSGSSDIPITDIYPDARVEVTLSPSSGLTGAAPVTVELTSRSGGVFVGSAEPVQVAGQWTARAVVDSSDGKLTESTTSLNVVDIPVPPRKLDVQESVSKATVKPGTAVTFAADVSVTPPYDTQTESDRLQVEFDVRDGSGHLQKIQGQRTGSGDHFEASFSSKSKGKFTVVAHAAGLDKATADSAEAQLKVEDPPGTPWALIITVIVIGLLVVAAAYSLFFVPRFPKDAVLAFPMNDVDMRGNAHGGFLTGQRLTIGAGSDDVDIGAQGTEAEIVATRSHYVRVSPMAEGISVDSTAVEGEATMKPGSTIAGKNWRAEYGHEAPDSGDDSGTG